MGKPLKNERYDYLKLVIEVLPNKPGVYQYFDKNGNYLYIGKARDLKKRVSSYFTRSNKDNYKMKVLVSKIASIKHIVVSTESDALLLENNLVKKHQPRYNVMLKDDKTFPWICIKNERFPRVFYTRNLIQDGSVYYGPYTSVVMVKTLIELIRQLYPLRTCKLNLDREHIESGKYKVCLEYHMGNCKAPCINMIKQEDYNEYIKQVHQILKGNIRQVSMQLKKLMKIYSAEYRFEDAQLIKSKIEILDKYRSKSTIVNQRINNLDVFSIVEEENFAFVNYLKIVSGAIVQAHTVELKKKLDETNVDLLSLAIIDIRQKIKSDAREIIVPLRIELPLGNIRFVVPVKGDKKHLLELSERNAKHYQLERKKKAAQSKTENKTARVLETMKKDLRLKVPPKHIECFDNSNLQGTDPVAACVVFRDAKPSKKEYRHYHVKTVRGPDDFASMEEIIFRRYRRLLDENQALPQLVVIDGGKGQLNAAVKSLEKLNLHGKMAIIGVAKRLEELYYPGDKVPLYIDKNSETLKIIQQLRNEAHRFGIAFHREVRSRSMINSELDSIKGIGEQTKQRLLLHFNSVDGIRNAGFESLKEIIGLGKATILINYFKKNNG
ncbi:MAG: excinuclease ABC subunit C [Bacteroides sp. SM23_62]|nr:MAG: excinuclease ABC subunit C [Bacteroides sp. SM23_62]